MAAKMKLMLLPGDGIGQEVMAQVKRILAWMETAGIAAFEIDEGLIGGCSIDAFGVPLADATLARCLAADAVLMGAVGGPKWESLPFEVRPERGLLRIRKDMGLFANLRPALVFEELADASSLKREVVAGLDIMIVRELIGGIYFGQPRGIEDLPGGGRRGFNTMVYTTPEIQRIGRVAFDLAMKRNRKVCSVDKANVLENTVLWREEMTALAKDYPAVELSHLYVDNATMQLVRAPKQFDVIVTTNMFGDILSDCASMLTGSLGMLPSASLGGADANGRRRALYEPVHGSAPDIAGKDLANPLAMILSLAMMLRYSFDMDGAADLVETAVRKTLARGVRTGDIMQPGAKRVGTAGMGDAVLQELQRLRP